MSNGKDRSDTALLDLRSIATVGSTRFRFPFPSPSRHRYWRSPEMQFQQYVNV